MLCCNWALISLCNTASSPLPPFFFPSAVGQCSLFGKITGPRLRLLRWTVWSVDGERPLPVNHLLWISCTAREFLQRAEPHAAGSATSPPGTQPCPQRFVPLARLWVSNVQQIRAVYPGAQSVLNNNTLLFAESLKMSWRGYVGILGMN